MAAKGYADKHRRKQPMEREKRMVYRQMSDVLTGF